MDKKWEGPREKILKEGVLNLKDEELLAVLLKTGRKGENVIELAKNLLNNIISLENLYNLDANELMTYQGIGPAKATTLLAAFEIYKRIEKRQTTKKVVRNSSDLYEIVKDAYLGATEEMVYAVFLGPSFNVLVLKLMAKGTSDHTVIDSLEILRKALIIRASSVALIHNHPSGSLRPSEADLMTTDKVEEKLSGLGIHLFDHLIVSPEGYYSIKYGEKHDLHEKKT